MLDTETKRRIDTARDILVGKVPDPKSQVEQITIALIYKFMDDLDALSEELGGQRKFFAHDFAHYGWTKLMRAGLGGHAMLNLYAEAIERMPHNPGIPPLFRSIFNNAYLPYRDPQTLRAFLKVINEFTYDHSERLGDAFEYLLSVLGSQGDAGQFRTPRHIIDFMVALLNPQKEERVLDPACGTAGFLISAYKHILAANTDAQGHSTLTPAERGQLAANICGYDISPDMVRLSLVNLYLHRFVDPHIYEYDTLTSEERWHEYADVILANPPFMTPKGGIRPHSRFVVRSKRSEVLFVSYIAEHLTSVGRAGIIVPEGIIFQSQQAYKQLRKLLVEEMLVAVVSLPSGVFQPYSGVKTSILILDRALARRVEHIAFFKIEHDGYDLGAQRRPIERDDLPLVRGELSAYLDRVRSGEVVDVLQSDVGLVVEKRKIAGNGEYNLSGERYRENNPQLTNYPYQAIGSLVETITPPAKIPKIDFGETGRYPIIDQSQKEIAGWTNDERVIIHPSKPLVIFGDHTCIVKLASTPFAQGADGIKILQTTDNVYPQFLYHILRVRPLENDGYRRHFSKLKEYEIPLPPLEVQREIVAEIEGYQKVLDGARMVVDNYRPHLHIDPEWPLVALGDSKLFSVVSGGTPKSSVKEYWNGGIPWATLVDLPPNDFITEIRATERTISEHGLHKSSAKLFAEDSVVVSTRATIGRIGINRIPLATNQGFKNIIIKDRDRIIPEYLALALTKLVPTMDTWASGGTFKEISKSKFCELKVPLPPLAVQQEIAAEIEAEQALVSANREMVQRFERKIQAAIGRVWGG